MPKEQIKSIYNVQGTDKTIFILSKEQIKPYIYIVKEQIKSIYIVQGTTYWFKKINLFKN